MMEIFQQFQIVDQLSVQDRLLVYLSIGIIFLLILAIFTAFLALVFRLRNHLNDKMWSGLRSNWENDLLDILSGDLSQDELL